MAAKVNRKRRLVTYSRISFSLWFVLSFSLLMISTYFIIEYEKESLVRKLGSMTSDVLNKYRKKSLVDKSSLIKNEFFFQKINSSPSPYRKVGFLKDSRFFFRFGESHYHSDGCEFFIGYTEQHMTLLIKSKAHFLKSSASEYGEIIIKYFDDNNNEVEGILVISEPSFKDREDGLTEKANLYVLKDGEREDDKVERKPQSFAGIIEEDGFFYINARINNTSITRENNPDFSSNPKVKLKIDRFGKSYYYCNVESDPLNDISHDGSIDFVLKEIFEDVKGKENVRMIVNLSNSKTNKLMNEGSGFDVFIGKGVVSGGEVFVDHVNGEEYSILLTAEAKKIFEEIKGKVLILLVFFSFVLFFAYVNKKLGSLVVKRLYSFTDLINENIKIVSQNIGNDLKLGIKTEELKRKDEIGDMARSFNYLLSLVEEKNNRLNIENKNRANFNEMLGHEITSPLTSLEHIVKTEKEKRLVNRAKRAIKILQEARDASRYFVSTDIERTEINNLIDQYVSASHFDGLLFERSTGECFCNVDRDMFEQALDNVIGNADEHRINNSKIKISLNRKLHKVIVLVENFGLNINEDTISKIFLYGFSTKKEVNSKNRGQGLFIVNCIVSSLGGIVRVENTETGVKVLIELVSIN